MTSTISLPDYPAFLEDLKERILQARTVAARAVNHQLVLLYWDIGRDIVEKQQTAGWGDAVVERLAADLRAELPDVRGFSSRNTWDMCRFCGACTDSQFLSEAAGEMARNPKPLILRQPVAELESHDLATGKISSKRAGESEFLEQAVQESGNGKNPQKFTAQLPETNVIEFLRQLVAEIPWGHHLLILNKLTAPAARLYYLRATAQLGWSRNILLN